MPSGILDYFFSKTFYHRAPEGKDPVGKIIALGKYGVLVTPFAAIYDCVLFSHPTTPLQLLNLWAFWMAPVTAVGVTFSSIAFSLCRLRKKDDKLNYIGGALAAGGVSHFFIKDIRFSSWATFAMVLYAVLKKQSLEDGQGEYLFITPQNENHHRANFKWRNVPYTNFLSEPKFPINKEDYYMHHG